MKQCLQAGQKAVSAYAAAAGCALECACTAQPNIALCTESIDITTNKQMAS